MNARLLVPLSAWLSLMAPRAAAEASRSHQAAIHIGFAHWYGSTFGTPKGIDTPTLTLGYSPAPWFEARARYTASLVALDLPNGERSRVGFVTIGGLLSHELRAHRERIRLGVGPLFGCVHTADGAGVLYGVGLSTRLLLDVTQAYALGPYLDVTAVQYRLPGDRDPVGASDDDVLARHSDAQIDLGVAMNFW